MIPTVEQVLELPVVAAGQPQIVGGSDSLDRPVRWVHISESPDLTTLLEGGELVLSTGLPLSADAESAGAYLRMLASAQAVGLIVELGTRLTTVPPGLSELADELPLPLVTLHSEIRFVDVTQQVHRLIVTDQLDEVEFARTTHEIFTSLNISRASTSEIVDRAAQLLGTSLVLEDLSRQVLAFAAIGNSPARLLTDWAARSRHPQQGGGWTAVPVGLGTERWGRLVIPHVVPNAPRATMVLERAAQSLELHRMIDQERDALVVHALGTLLDDLITSRVNDDAEAMARATALGLASSPHYMPLVVRLAPQPDTDALTQGGLDQRLLSGLRHAVAAADLTAIASLRQHGTVYALIAAGQRRDPDRALQDACTQLGQRLAGQHHIDWAAGTGPASPSLLEAARGLPEAEHVAEAGLTMPDRNRLYRSTDIRLRGLVTMLRHDPRLQSFAETELGRLLDHDARTDDNLLDLLRTHLNCGGAKAITARETGLSRPTLYSRLRRLERVLGVSLENAESRTSLHTALMITDANRLQ